MVMWHVIRISLTALFLSGCVTLSKSYPEKQYYVLDVAREAEKLPSVPGTVLKIRKFRISPAFEGKELVYRLGAAHYEADFYNEWFVLPNSMLTLQTLNWLAAAGLFQYVLDSSETLPATYILQGTVTALYGDYSATPTKAIQYRKEVEVVEQSPEALVSGWNGALRLILTAVEADMKQALVAR